MNINKRFYYLFFLLSILIFTAGAYAQTADSLYFSVAIKTFKYDYQRNTTSYNGCSGKFAENVFKNAHLEVKFDKKYGGLSLSLGPDAFTSNMNARLTKYIKNKLQIQSKEQKTVYKFSEDLRYKMLVKPILTKEKKLKDVLFSIEKQTRLDKLLQDGDIYKSDYIVLSEKELKKSKKFNFVKGGQHLDDLVPGDPNLKMIIHENESYVYFVTFEFSLMGSEKKNDSIRLDFKKLNPAKDINIIKAPFSYDIKYTNSDGVEKIVDGIKQSEEFMVDVRVQEIVNSTTHKLNYIRYYLRGIFYPIKHNKKELTIHMVLSAENVRYDINGNRVGATVTTYHKDVLFEPQDVIEVQLPDNWPRQKFGHDYDPATLEKKDEYSLNAAIAKQSLFIRPVIK